MNNGIPYRIWVSVVGPTYQEASNQIKKASKYKKDIQGLELRIDLLKDRFLRELIEETHEHGFESIATMRSKAEGGAFEGDDTQYRKEIQYAIESGADIIDIEAARNFKPELPSGTKILTSVHEPADKALTLNDAYGKVMATDSHIKKIAMRPESLNDSMNILAKIKEAVVQEKKNFIGIGMGGDGLITRLLGPAFGGYATFYALDKNTSSAPGQVPVEKAGAIKEVLADYPRLRELDPLWIRDQKTIKKIYKDVLKKAT